MGGYKGIEEPLHISQKKQEEENEETFYANDFGIHDVLIDNCLCGRY